MEISILGTGCYNCLKLEMLLARLLEELDLPEAHMARVDDPHQIRQFIPEDAAPGLVINGRLVSSGHLPDETEISGWLSQAAQVEQAA